MPPGRPRAVFWVGFCNKGTHDDAPSSGWVEVSRREGWGNFDGGPDPCRPGQGEVRSGTRSRNGIRPGQSAIATGFGGAATTRAGRRGHVIAAVRNCTGALRTRPARISLALVWAPDLCFFSWGDLVSRTPCPALGVTADEAPPYSSVDCAS